ncbi:uncharacterized protein LOC114851031 [Betta splendens]|uniref:Uncharacterized protein LOC114851031 n=1 Tax=Betta splendens TaxID=158456 RepID=A0A6P7LUA2_BETSP|nr:uncharacterized protein LOC114851031 [Betta splendens]XP_028998387.1 uncharacterized protein LOC114851031 [Betta splendens]
MKKASLMLFSGCFIGLLIIVSRDASVSASEASEEQREAQNGGFSFNSHLTPFEVVSAVIIAAAVAAVFAEVFAVDSAAVSVVVFAFVFAAVFAVDATIVGFDEVTNVVLAVVFAVLCKYLVKEISKLNKKVVDLTQIQKQSQCMLEELGGWETVFFLLTRLKLDQEKQRQEFTEKLKRTKKEMEETKQQLQLVEKEIKESEKEMATDKTEEGLRNKQKVLDALRKLDERKGDLDRRIMNVEKLQLETEAAIKTATQRKEKVEKYKEMMKSQLNGKESQSESVHLHSD